MLWDNPDTRARHFFCCEHGVYSLAHRLKPDEVRLTNTRPILGREAREEQRRLPLEHDHWEGDFTIPFSLL